MHKLIMVMPKMDKAYHLGDHILVQVHIVAAIAHIQCYCVPMFQCITVEWKLKGFDGFKFEMW